jgi:putative transposase
MSTNPIPLEHGFYYHIFNRGNNHENIFPQQRNYTYFMELWWKHTLPIADTLAFGLLRNHFHASVFVKYKEDLKDIELKEPSQYFANFFNAYSRGVNNAIGRSGALFERPFERILVTDESYLMRLIVYIHQNPQKHKFVDDFRDWPYTSYTELLGTKETRLKRDKVLELFGGRDGFVRYHQEIQPQVDLDDEE